MKRVLMLVAALATGHATPLGAQWKDWDYKLDQEKRPWEELQSQLPPYPKPDNLIKFEFDGAGANQFFVDAASLSVGDDGVVRYTLVIKTAGGATNVSFEGLRCDVQQVRIYALGHPGNQWSRARDTAWRDIRPREINGYHFVLGRDYYCLPATLRQRGTRPVADILRTLKRGPARYEPSTI